MAQKTFFAPKGKNYYPKYPTRGGDFSTMYQKEAYRKPAAEGKGQGRGGAAANNAATDRKRCGQVTGSDAGSQRKTMRGGGGQRTTTSVGPLRSTPCEARQ